jgi:hypothetical protein
MDAVSGVKTIADADLEEKILHIVKLFYSALLKLVLKYHDVF